MTKNMTRRSVPGQGAGSGALARIASCCYRRRWLVLLAWLVVGIGVIGLGLTHGAPGSDSFGGAGTSSVHAQHLLAAHFSDQFAGDRLTLAVHADAGVDDPAVRARIEGVLARLRASPHVVSVTSPAEAPDQVSADAVPRSPRSPWTSARTTCRRSRRSG